MTSPWSFVLARLLALIVVALAAGLIFGRPLAWVIAALALYLCVQLVNLYRLDRWLRLRNFIDPPDLGGAWADVVAQVVRLHRRKRFHKQRLIQLFRELRRSTAAMVAAPKPVWTLLRPTLPRATRPSSTLAHPTATEFLAFSREGSSRAAR